MSIYQEIILNHYQHPHNHGVIPEADSDVHVVNSACGDSIRITLTTTPDGSRIKDIAFEGHGCAISTASASMLTDHIKNMSREKVKNLNTQDILRLLGIELTPGRIRCALLPLEGVHSALHKLEG